VTSTSPITHYSLRITQIRIAMTYRLLKHKAYDESLKRLPPAIKHKAAWAQVLLGIRGRTPSVKGTRGLNARWRRTPVQGNHYYMWWIPRSEGMVAGPPDPAAERETILIHSIRHHDQTDEPLDPGSLADYEEIALANLDPRYDEQLELSRRLLGEQLSLATIKGLPGSGKTVSLLYLVKDLAQQPGVRKLLYVTYSSRLKRAARDFLLAQDDAISQAVTIRTLGEIEQELTGLSSAGEPLVELRDFIRHLEVQNPATLGPWRKYPQTLYTEIRAHLLGRTFPPRFQLPDGQPLPNFVSTGERTPDDYARARDLDLTSAALVVNLAERMQTGRFFQDQRAAKRAIERLQAGKIPGWLADQDALVVDEVQDLTLVQIALLGELVCARLRRRPSAPFVFTVAGDESQIVQPSGFDWGVTKRLLGEQLGIWPEEFEFHYQRRSPRNLAQLIDNTWSLYTELPKEQRPSARRQAFAYDETPAGEAEHNGRILRCAPPPLPTTTADPWAALLTELVEKPGRVIIDLTEQLRPALGSISSAGRDEVIFLPREIKGLERATVLIYGLNSVYERAMRLCETHVDGNIPLFEARRLFDEIRVALSRSTEKIILLEPPGAPVLDHLEIEHLPGAGTLSWDALIDLLQTEEMSDLEVVEGYLDEVDDLFERSLWTQGYRRNRRAYDLAVQLGDRALQREVEEQYIRGHLLEADELLRGADWRAALERNRRAETLAQAFGDPLLQDEVADQAAAISALIADHVRRQLTQAQEQHARAAYAAAYDLLLAARADAALATDPTLHTELDEALTVMVWAWALELATTAHTAEQSSQIAHLLEEAAAAMARQADAEGASAATLLAQRYHEISTNGPFNEAQMASLLSYTERYLALLKPLRLDGTAYAFARIWVQEALDNLHLRTALYARWVLLAQELTQHLPDFDVDEALWDLENRLNLLLEQGKRSPDDPGVTEFQALIAAYNGDAQAAAETLERLGDYTNAAAYARDAGELERAYRLLHQAKIPIPEDLATAVKAVRLLQQLRSKHTGLRPAERRALLAELTALQTAMAQTDSMTDLAEED
jgi:hypothetical protein